METIELDPRDMIYVLNSLPIGTVINVTKAGYEIPSIGKTYHMKVNVNYVP